MEWTAPGLTEDLGEQEIIERLAWLLRLRWVIVPVFVAVELANGLLLGRGRAPWTALLVGAALLAANGVYALLLRRRSPARTLVRWARIESYVIVATPAILVLLHRDASDALRYGVLVGVVGAAAALPLGGDVARVAVWALASLVFADALAAGFDPARMTPATVARWAIEAILIGTVALLAIQLQSERESASRRARAAQESLERSRAEWEATFDGLAEIVVVTDEQGRVVRANRAFAKLLGARPHDLALRPLRELLAGHPERWWSSAGDGIAEIEDPAFDAVFEVTSTRLSGRVVRIARDVGEQRRLHSLIVQADKLAAVGMLASGVAHEINNPTAVVTSNLAELNRYLVAYEAALTDLAGLALRAGLAERVGPVLMRPEVVFARREAATAVSESLQGMERVRQIVTNLRSLARRDQAGEPPAPVELGEVVQAVVRTAASDLRLAAARVDVRGPVWTLGHRGELVDVVLNLVVNAVQARVEGRPNRIGVELFLEGSAALIRVSDTGRGISASHMKRLFEPFFTTKAPGEGTGLGLSLARKIVLAHGGSIDVTSEAGAGSTFTVRLPALEPAADAPPMGHGRANGAT
jgi:two-component system NtrC family sensor kinase